MRAPITPSRPEMPRAAWLRVAMRPLRWRRAPRGVPVLRASRGLALIVAVAACGAAHATAYRCDDGQRVTYTNLPCPAGRQTEIVDVPAPSAADRDAADARNRADRARLADLERDRGRQRRDDARDAVATARVDARRDRRVAACLKLQQKARRARDDHEHAGPRTQERDRVRMLRADDDYRASCRKR